MSRSMAVKYFFLLVLVMGLATVALAQFRASGEAEVLSLKEVTDKCFRTHP